MVKHCLVDRTISSEFCRQVKLHHMRKLEGYGLVNDSTSNFQLLKPLTFSCSRYFSYEHDTYPEKFMSDKEERRPGEVQSKLCKEE